LTKKVTTSDSSNIAISTAALLSYERLGYDFQGIVSCCVPATG
jgi:hypothetical protein